MLLPRIICAAASWAVGTFLDVERGGPPLPDGPVLLVANHPNALVDPLVVFRTAGRVTRPLAKAPLFDQALVGTVLRGLGGLPVYRRQDDPALVHLNEGTFDAAIDALRRGEAVQIYPEGRSHSEPSLVEIRTGAARIALMAEERSHWSLGLRVVPVGLTYARKHLFRGRVVAAVGRGFEVAEYREAYEAKPQNTVRALTDRIRSVLESVTVNVESPDDRALIEVAERIYAREKRLGRRGGGTPLAERLPRLQAFAAGVRWLRAYDPHAYERLRHSIRRYLRYLTVLGAGEGDIPTRYRPAAVLRYALGQTALLALVLPVAMVGLAFWAVPVVLTRKVHPLFRPKLDQIATYKLGLAMIVFPLWLVLATMGAWLAFGAGAAAALTFGGPLAGLATIAWRERQSRVRENFRVNSSGCF